MKSKQLDVLYRRAGAVIWLDIKCHLLLNTFEQKKSSDASDFSSWISPSETGVYEQQTGYWVSTQTKKPQTSVAGGQQWDRLWMKPSLDHERCCWRVLVFCIAYLVNLVLQWEKGTESVNFAGIALEKCEDDSVPQWNTQGSEGWWENKRENNS